VDVSVGDTIEVRSVQVGQQVRRGVVTQMVATDPLEVRVRWEDGHESVFFPSGGMAHVVQRAGGSAG
jgi:hypothetical protein